MNEQVVYVALWRINYEGDSLIGVFTTREAAEVAADAPDYNDIASHGVVEAWPLDRAVDFPNQDLPLRGEELGEVVEGG
jgi:hypothetical protein